MTKKKKVGWITLGLLYNYNIQNSVRLAEELTHRSIEQNKESGNSHIQLCPAGFWLQCKCKSMDDG